jgi:long-subunit acyl-CoA synthetase (AMP-forming)
MDDIATDATLRAEVQDAVNKVNSTVSHAEGIKKFYRCGRETMSRLRATASVCASTYSTTSRR